MPDEKPPRNDEKQVKTVNDKLTVSSSWQEWTEKTEKEREKKKNDKNFQIMYVVVFAVYFPFHSLRPVAVLFFIETKTFVAYFSFIQFEVFFVVFVIHCEFNDV